MLHVCVGGGGGGERSRKERSLLSILRLTASSAMFPSRLAKDAASLF